MEAHTVETGNQSRKIAAALLQLGSHCSPGARGGRWVRFRTFALEDMIDFFGPCRFKRSRGVLSCLADLTALAMKPGSQDVQGPQPEKAPTSKEV